MGLNSYNKVVDDIINEIRYIQSTPYSNWISAMGKKLRVDKLHRKLDDIGYRGERPPRNWNQLSNTEKDNDYESHIGI